MKRWLLTLPILLVGMVGLVRADYFLIAINTGAAAGDPSKGGTTTPPNASDFLGVIVESNNPNPFTPTQRSIFERNGPPPLPAKYLHYNLHLTHISSISVVKLYADKGDKPTDVHVRYNVRRIFLEKHEETKNKTPPLELAEWALAHGLVDKFAETMDKLALDEKAKADPRVAAYLRIKTALNAKIESDPTSAWAKRLKDVGFSVIPSDHYYLLHNVTSEKKKADVRSRLDRFEEAFKTFYYWYAMHGRVLPLPREKLVVLVAGDNEDDENNLKEFRTIADGSAGRLAARHEDGFFGRREGIVYLSLASREPNFEKMNAFASSKFEQSKKTVEDWLKEKYSPVRPGTPDPWVLALAVKALETNAERLAVSHNASRQLAFASGLLPRYVDVPEWMQYGMGSFFETPLNSPWTSPGAPSCQHLKPCVDILEKRGADLGDILKQVVTDDYFHQAEAAEEKDSAAALAKARALSWGLTYYLIQRKGNVFNAYCEELDKMPRDLALDGDVVLGCFARAVGAVDANRKVDARKLHDVAVDWKQYLEEKKNAPEALEPLGPIDGLQALIKAYQETLKAQ